MAHESSSRVISLGDLVAAAVDRAEVVTTDPGLAATLASRTVARWLGRTGRPDLARRLQVQTGAKRPGRRTPFSRAA